jgi:hypothetical protein
VLGVTEVKALASTYVPARTREGMSGGAVLGCLRQLVTKMVTYGRQLEGKYWLGTVVSELQFHIMLPLLVRGDSTS